MRSSGRYPNSVSVILVVLGLCVGQLSAPFVRGVAAQTPLPPEPASTLPPDVGHIKIGYVPTISLAPILLAAGLGFFEAQGLETELEPFRSGSTMISMLSTGGLDLGGGEVGTAFFNAVEQDMDVRMVAGLGSEPPGYGATPLLVRRDLFDSGEVTTPAGLRGRKVGVHVVRGISEYVLSAALAQGGLTLEDVELVIMPLPDLSTALANKSVDAMLTAGQFATQAIEDEAGAILLGGDEMLDSPQISVLYFGRNLLDAGNREVAVRAMVACLQGARAAYGDGWRSKANLDILSKYTGVAPAVLEKSVPYYLGPNGEMNRTSVEKTQAFYISRGYTEYPAALDFEQFYDETILAEALERLGRFEPPTPGDDDAQD